MCEDTARRCLYSAINKWDTVDLTSMTVLFLWCWNRFLDLLELQQIGSYMKIKTKGQEHVWSYMYGFCYFKYFLDFWGKLCTWIIKKKTGETGRVHLQDESVETDSGHTGFYWSSEGYEKIFGKWSLAEMVKYSVLSSSLLVDFHFVIVVVGNSSELDLSRQVCSANKWLHSIWRHYH